MKRKKTFRVPEAALILLCFVVCLAASLDRVKPLRGGNNTLLHPASFAALLWLALFALTAADTMSLMLI